MTPSAPALLLLLASTACALPQDLADRMEARIFESPEHGSIPYRAYVPTAKKADHCPHPLVLFLHGAGERGTDNRAQLRHGVGDFVSPRAQALYPCQVIAPQCASDARWTDERNLEILAELVHELAASPAVDPDRIYLTGLSMGGEGTWHLAARHPGLFAAALPICGKGEPAHAARLKELPIWAFHGTRDDVVPVAASRDMIAAIEKAFGHPRCTEYPGARHDSWTATYADRRVHAWLFAQRRPPRPPPPLTLRAGDRIVFLGDSITAAATREGGFIRVIEGHLKRDRPDLEVHLIGAGISGNRVPHLLARLDRDVLAKRPTVVIIYIGINDVWHWKSGRGTTRADYESGLHTLIARLRPTGARLLLCTPSVIGEKHDGTNPLDPMLDAYAAISRAVAARTHTHLLDLRHHFLDHVRHHNPTNTTKGILTRDEVHLNEAGNRFVAERMLEALGVR